MCSGRTGATLAECVLDSAIQGVQDITDAGDVDGDATPELLLLAQPDEWGPSTPTMFSVARKRALFSVLPQRGERRFGIGACGGRDLNGDGTPDFVVASALGGHRLEKLQWLLNPSRIRAFSGKDGKPLQTWFVPEDDQGTSFGESMAFIDDVDCDGRSEILVGNGDMGMFWGAAYLFSSRGETLRGISTHTGDWHFGRIVRAAGDLDGDGLGDYAIASTPYCLGETGAVRAFSGGSGACLWTVTRSTFVEANARRTATR
jgi:hypothetical protein